MPPTEQPHAKPAASGDLDHVNGAGHDGFPTPSERSGLHTRTLSFSELQSAGANPQRRGLPKRAPSLTKLVDDLVDEWQGDRSINSVLVANNGLAAVKFMRSIRSWANQTFGNSRAIALVAMATPEDIRINAEHVTLADQFVEVPGGTNNNNYANVKLIVQVAERAGVDAVWPGWGHASENPELPEALAARGIRFLGPPAAAMAALGDKIGSTILAQAAGVPTLPWSGSGVAISYAECGGVIPQDIYDKACVFTLDEAIESCNRIGYPVMLKASWGGGGKGIRKVQSDEDVRAVFKQIQGEVPGSPIFAMKLAPQSRHLEVQLLADRHGNVVSLFTRDCSVQRRHQKIVEEGPALAASQEALRDMERCARALAQSVGYQGAATVEYLYSIEEKKYYFLELNPRLQVEHPVTEGITNVNIPSVQLLIGMGVPLWRIPQIRATFQGVEARLEVEPFDMEHTPQRLPESHVVAVRITSENANNGFKPTAGRIDELMFKPTPEVWGYFSVKSGGGIHEFSDSQFGHLFAKGETREAAIRAMVVALRDVRVRGEIHTIIDYAVDMLTSGEFVQNLIHTAWLDSRIAANIKAERPPWHLCVIGSAVVRAYESITSKAAEYLGFLSKGQLPPRDVGLIHFSDDLVLEGIKYHVSVVRRGPTNFSVVCAGVTTDVVARKLGDGGYLLQVDGEGHVMHTEEEALGTRLVMDTLSCLIEKEQDPSKLIAMSPGKLVRQLVKNGEHVEKGQAYAEVEVMKMMMPLLSPAAGAITFSASEGAPLMAGELIATLDLDDPNAVTRAVDFSGSFPELGPPQVYSDRVDHRFAQALHAAKMIMAGYEHPVAETLDELVTCLDHPALPLLQWIEEYSFVEGRLPQSITEKLDEVITTHELELSSGLELDKPPAEFPGRQLMRVLREAVGAAPPAERAMLQTTLEPLMRVAKAHAPGKEEYAHGVVGDLLEQFIIVEEKFQQAGATEQEMIDALRKSYANNHQAVLDMVVSHQGLPLKLELVKRILSTLVLPSPVPYRTLLRRIAALSSKSCAEVALRAQQLLEVSLLADMRAVVARALSGLDMFSVSDGKLSPTAAVSAAMMSPFTASAAAAAAAGGQDKLLQATAQDLKVIARKATIREGVYAGLNSLLPPGGSLQLEGRLSLEGRVSIGGSTGSYGLAERLGGVGVGHTASPQRSSSGGPMTPHVEHKIETLVAAPAAVEEALASLIVDHQDPALQYRALLTYIKRVYHPFLLREPQVSFSSGRVVAAWIYDDPRLANTTHSRHQGGAFLVVRSLAELADSLPAVAHAMASLGTDCAGGVLHVAVCGSDAMKLSPSAEQLLAGGALGAAEPDAKVFSSAELIGHDGPQEKTRRVAAAVADAKAALRRLQVACVSVLAPGMSTMPLRSGFVWDEFADCFKYDPFLRQVEGPVARLLELDKLSSQQVLYMPSRNRQWHMYACSDREPRGPELKRLFLRGQVRQLGHPALLAAQYSGNTPAVATAAVNELEEALTNCLEELTRPAPDHSAAGKADWVHLFFSVLPLLPLHHAKEEGRVASALRSAVAALVAKHNTAFRLAGVAVWEIRFRVPDISGAWRVLVSCPTGHEAGEEHVEVYREALFTTSAAPAAPPGQGAAPAAPAATFTDLCYVVPVSEQQAGVQPSECGLHGRRLLEPYPRLEPLQIKRLAARRHNTTYCYDFPTVFENALRDVWALRAAQGEPNSVPPAGRLVEAVELKLPSGAEQDFRTARLKLERVEREPGLNNTGMVAWLMTLKTPECPQGRQVVAIANDITYQSGAFGPREDTLFRAATELALEERLPCIYLAANSGARLGVANEIRDNLRVAWVDDEDPTKGFSYIYLSDEDYHKQLPGGVSMGQSVRADALTMPAGEVRWVVSDIIGAEDGLGVENLSGSGAIASTYCRAWREGFTITLVSGRTVGIGAYLARLGRRCVQRADQPIILTGYAALNKVLGRQVYTSHMQLGGPRVMGVNGVSHHVVSDDLEGVKAILRWLSFAPSQLGAEPPRLATNDGADRPVSYSPAAHEKLDPRAAIAGRDVGGEAGWESGLFDRGSWVEAQAGWARSVVTGRARLNGVPVGVIAVETQTQMRHVPADPGDPASAEVDIPQAGQVWWPDSADKTAQAIEEFDREGLPLFILANWRGFAGGQRDLFEGVLQAGSLIVEQLRVYHQPVFVYIPGGGELRGGAWVVVDAQINPTHIEMYADPAARGGVLEPEGLVEIKFRTPDLIKAMHRLDPEIRRLKAEGGPLAEGSVKAREKTLLPIYQQVARQFADMHDTPARMYAKGTLKGVVPWREARRFFATRLQRRLVEEALVRHVASTDVSISRHAAIAMVGAWHAMGGALTHLGATVTDAPLAAAASTLWGDAPAAGAGAAAAAAATAATAAAGRGALEGMAAAQMEADRAFLSWAESPAGRAQIAMELKALRSHAASRLVTDMLGTAEGKEGLLKGLQAALATDTALATQLRSLLQRPSG